MEISVKAKGQLPGIEFHDNGNLLLNGRSNPEDPHKVYAPLFDFVSQLDVPNINFDIKLKYFNTASSKMLMQLFNYIEANNKIENIQINWYYEEGDEDSLESAEMYEESLLRCKFNFIEASLEG